MTAIEFLKISGPWITSLIGAVSFFVGLKILFNKFRNEIKFILCSIEEMKINFKEEITRHELNIKEINSTIDKQILPTISDLQANIKKNCQAVMDIKESCKERHYGINFSVPTQRQ